MARLVSIERVGLAGFGAVGQRVAMAIDGGELGVTLAAITSGNLEKARARAGDLLRTPPPVVPLREAVALSDLIVEAAPASAFPEIARTTLEGGKSLLVLSVGALLGHEQEYAELARQYGATIHIASGAIGGLDAITSASAGRVDAVVMTTRKPPKGLAGAPYLEAHGIDVLNLTEPQVVFEGSAREACRGFPANVNVSAAVSLAGIGADRTRIRIIADPTIDRNTHDVEITGEFGRFTMHIENVPTDNPRSGVLTALSVIATIRKLASPLQVGT
ncbi:MAG: aspartate dehydrogenase [Anaerolineae bacterium]